MKKSQLLNVVIKVRMTVNEVNFTTVMALLEAEPHYVPDGCSIARFAAMIMQVLKED